MSFRPLKITFKLDGSGIYYDPSEPLMLDSLMAAANSRWHVHGEPPSRDEEPKDIPLPLDTWRIGSVWGWRASAILPDDAIGESIVFWRKRLREKRIDITKGSPNQSMGVYRDWNTPLPLLLTSTMIAYAVGDRRNTLRCLRDIRYLGKKRSQGKGRIISVDVEVIDNDFSLYKDGLAMRWIPMKDGGRIVRPRPPYWNSTGRVSCCEVGSITLESSIISSLVKAHL